VNGKEQPAGAVTTQDRDLADEPPGDPEAARETAGDRTAADREAEDRGERADVRRAGRPWWRGTRGPLALALVLALAGGALTVRTARLRDDPAAANRALVDTTATTRVIGDVSNALTKIFSYSYADTAATDQAARDVLAGKAYTAYQALFAQVVRQAPAQGLTVTTRVVRAGVTRLSGGTAQLLVFLDQVITRRNDQSGTAAAAQLSVTAQLRDGHWRITDIQSR
jgi:Mce-associated membrane protein